LKEMIVSEVYRLLSNVGVGSARIVGAVDGLGRVGP